ncbi:hypothetical protein PG989_015619 [Apiospora arundinis]
MPGSRLSDKLFHGFAGGMFWETVPEWDPERNAFVSRALLYNKHMDKLYDRLRQASKRQVGKCIPAFDKATVSEAFGMIYEHASYNVHLCQELDPVAFFKEMKKPFPWAEKIEPELIWKFSYRALMARATFFELQPGAAHAPLHPMAKYLDKFKADFFHLYSPQYGLDPFSLPEADRDPQKILDARQLIFDTQAKYFSVELTCAGYHCDTEDDKNKVFVVQGEDGEDSSYGYMYKNREQSPAATRARIYQGIEENWLLEDGSANPYYTPEWLDDVAPEDEEDNHDTEDADEEEYQKWLESHEREWDIYMGRHQMNPEEDNEMSGVMSKLEM